MREKNSDYIYFPVRTYSVLFSFDKSCQRDTLYIQGKQFSGSNFEVFMTIYSFSIFDGTLYSPVFTEGSTRPLPIEVPTIWAVKPDRTDVVACSNLSSARAYADGRAPEKNDTHVEASLKVRAYRSPSGQYYVKHGNQRLDCHNQATARYYVRNGVPTSVMLEATLSDLASSLNQ